MSNFRKYAYQAVLNRKSISFDLPANKVSDFFGENCFNDSVMREMLAPDVYKRVKIAIEEGKKIDLSTADSIAYAAKNWATQKGVTHFTHWFQPLTGATAEKHDAFFDSTSGLENFKGTELIQAEPDASSFPSGGIRSTFEARGYTGWDPSSPIFILGKTLCIPTVFISYTGETLDYKGSLLKSEQALNKAAVAVCKYFEPKVKKVIPTLGCEQEYFAIDRAFYLSRPDLMMSGRTVFGHASARGQQMDDHYFGAIPTRILNFIRDFEVEAWKLGIPVTTRHNEVAPGQFEVAQVYEELNIATDHNLLIMELLQRVGERHDLAILMHEKPFAGLNGSGKHNNWSLATDTGRNLLNPSLSNPKDSLYFLTFFINVIKAVAEYSDILRASVCSAGNDYRLGANEAPPAIMSVFIGEQLTALLDEMENTGVLKTEYVTEEFVKLGIEKIPELSLDTTDRNRTSPFAFTGNKFEFRAVGSSANSAGPMTVLNIIVAEQLRKFKEAVDSRMLGGKKKEEVILKVLIEYVKDSRKVRFEGDGYSDAWIEEAAKRGLSNVKDTPRALDEIVSNKTIELFGNHNVFNISELRARHEVWLENYIMKAQIDARVIGDLALNHIIPTATSYQNKLVNNATGQKSLGLNPKGIISTIEEISHHIEIIKENVSNMIEERKRINQLEDTREKAIEYCDNIKNKYFDKIRYSVDKLELLVDDEDWTLPKYREMLFMR